MIVMGGGARAMAVWGIVSIVILLLSYLLIVKPILNDTNDQIDSAFNQSEQLQENIQDNVDESLDQGQGGKGGKGGNAGAGQSAQELQQQIQDQVNQQLEDAGVAP